MTDFLVSVFLAVSGVVIGFPMGWMIGKALFPMPTREQVWRRHLNENRRRVDWQD